MLVNLRNDHGLRIPHYSMPRVTVMFHKGLTIFGNRFDYSVGGFEPHRMVAGCYHRAIAVSRKQ